MDPHQLERRRFPRLQLLRRDHDTLHLHDASLGGFAVESPRRFSPGEDHQVVFTLASGKDLRIRAVVTHCGPAPAFRPSTPRYWTGFAFRIPSGDKENVENQIKVILAAALSEPIGVTLAD